MMGGFNNILYNLNIKLIIFNIIINIFIQKLNQLSIKDTGIAGGKGASLGEMIQSKFPIPDGFVILSNYFDKFMEENNLNDVKIALGIFIGQLILNTLWSIIFFSLHSPAGAFIELIVLWLAILATIISFAKISRPAAWFLLPYILWVSFDGYLNFNIWQLNKATGSGQVACTQEAKLCPDGSYVGRTGPNCEFAQCPGENNDLWKTTTDSKTGITFKYPETLLTTYIHTQDWPPQIQVLNQPFTCTEAGSETARAGITMKRMVDDRTYCVTKESEGAAGSIYTNYAYAFPMDGKTSVFTFSLRSVQCFNYDDSQKTACENERSAFDLNSTVDRIARSIK